MREILFIIMVLFPMAMFSQTTYYVSNSEGNDLNSGTNSGRPWKSLDKVNSFTPNPGDKVLFSRSDEWEGTLTISASGNSGSPIVYGAYGTGEKPKIYGSDIVTGWTLHSGNIYKATISASAINQVFFNGVRAQASRYPNSGYFDVTGASSTVFTSTDLSATIDYSDAIWTGRTREWTLATQTVVSSSSQTITLDAAPAYSLGVDEGFFLTGKLAFLDQAGEWYFESATNTLYVWTPTGASPDGIEVRASVRDYGIAISNKNYVTIQNLDILHSNIDGVHADNCDYLTLNDVDLYSPEGFGMLISGNNSNNTSISNCYINGANHDGISIAGSYHTISNNEILNTGEFTTLGLTGLGDHWRGRGISVAYGNHNTISYNTVIGTAYNGIQFFDAPYTTIEYNVIKNVCLVMEDGGGIYTYSSDLAAAGCEYSEIRGNIIDYSKGTIAGYPNTMRQGCGIYIDERIHDVIIEDNTVSQCSYVGIFLHDNKNITIRNNTIFDAGCGYLFTNSHGGNIIDGNVVCNIASTKYADGGSAELARLSSTQSNTYLINNNTYIDHHRDWPFRNNNGYTYNTFPEWQTVMNQDANSTFDGTPLTEGVKEKLLYNDTKEAIVVDLGSSTYKDIYGNQVSGSLTLNPFTSKILTGANLDEIKEVNKSPSIQGQTFNINENKAANDFIGKVVASDPDLDQTLSYSITQRNDGNIFTINSTTGEIFATTIISATSDKSFLLVVNVTDNATNSLSASANITININSTSEATDTTIPTITSFSIPTNATSLTIPIISFTAIDNNTVTAYQLTVTPTPPTGDGGWTSSAPETFTFSQAGTQKLYAWVKDAAGNISTSFNDIVIITLPAQTSDFSEYLFEESSGAAIIDSQGSNDGTILNNVFRIDGVNGDGLEFKKSGYLNLGQSFGNNVSNEISLSTWIKPTSVTGDYQGVIMHGGLNYDTFALYIHPGDKSISFKTSGTSSAFITYSGVNDLWDGEWHHVAATYDGAQKVIYFDGQILTTVNASGTIESGQGYNLLIGAGRDEATPTLLYEGLIDEVRIHNTALTSTEINNLYHLGEKEPNALNTIPTIQNQNFEIRKNLKLGELIGQVIATDPDFGQTLSYSFIQGNEDGLFSINPETGEIFTKKTISATANQSMLMVVSVTDDSETPLSASANITIDISIVSKLISAEVNNSDPKTIILYYSHLLQVDNLKSSQTYSDFSLNNNKSVQQLTINGSEIYLNINSEYQYGDDIIVTYNKGTTPLYDESGNEIESFSNYIVTNNLIQETTTDTTTNHSPVIQDQLIEINKHLKMGEFIGQEMASDPDLGQTLTYSILQGNEDDLFSIDPETGKIFTNKRITASTNQSVVLVVEVTDDAENPLSATANVVINITITSKLVKGEVNNTNPKRIVLYYSDPLQTGNLKSSQIYSDFSLNNNKSVLQIGISGSEIYLDIDSEYQYDDEIIINYNKGTTPLYDESGNEIESFTGYLIDNNLIMDIKTDIGSISDSDALEVSVYPNPTNGIFNIKANNLKSDICEIALFSMMGNLVTKKILSGSFGNMEENLNMSHLNKGTYILRFVCEQQTYQSKIIFM